MGNEPKPKKLNPKTELLRELYHTIGELITLESAGKSNKLVILGDLHVVFDDDLKLKIAERQKTKLSAAAGLIRDLQAYGE